MDEIILRSSPPTVSKPKQGFFAPCGRKDFLLHGRESSDRFAADL